MLPILLLSAVVILLGIVCSRVSQRFGVPILLLFIALGMLFGSDGLFKIPFDNYDFAEQICSVALVILLFYGGFGTNWRMARPVAAKAVVLSTAGVVLTAGLTGLFCHYILHIELLESLLIGAVIGSTDAASVFSVLRSKRLNLKYNTASLLEVESGSNDPCSYMLTVLVLSLMGDGGNVPFGYLVFAQVAYGLAFGVAVALAARWVLRRFSFANAGFDALFVLALALLAYALPTALEGNGYLSVYLFGVILGNTEFPHKVRLVHFFDGINSLAQMLVFFLLGLLSFPSQLPAIFLMALAIAAFLTLVARPAAVFALLSPFRCPIRQQLLVSFAGLRGASSIVFAIIATISSAYTHMDVFHIVFCVVLLSISLQGTLLPLVAKKLGMVDDRHNVLKTFNDYQKEAAMQFLELEIVAAHPWNGQTVSHIVLPAGTLLVMLRRGEETLTPRGDTVLRAGDVAVLGAPAFSEERDHWLEEREIDPDDDWVGKPLSQLALPPGELVVMIRRAGGAVVIPDGDTTVAENDTMVLYTATSHERSPL